MRFFIAVIAALVLSAQADDPVTGRLLIPAIGVNVPLVTVAVEGRTWDVSSLGFQAGWMEQTAAPGAGSNVVLAGHYTLPGSGANGPFRYVDQLANGDEIVVITGSVAYTYLWDKSYVVDKSQIEVTYETPNEQLTLVSCIRPGDPGRERRITVARLISIQAIEDWVHDYYGCAWHPSCEVA